MGGGYARRQGTAAQSDIAVIDRNGIQIDGFTRDVMPLEPLREKFESL